MPTTTEEDKKIRHEREWREAIANCTEDSPLGQSLTQWKEAYRGELQEIIQKANGRIPEGIIPINDWITAYKMFENDHLMLNYNFSPNRNNYYLEAALSTFKGKPEDLTQVFYMNYRLKGHF